MQQSEINIILNSIYYLCHKYDFSIFCMILHNNVYCFRVIRHARYSSVLLCVQRERERDRLARLFSRKQKNGGSQSVNHITDVTKSTKDQPCARIPLIPRQFHQSEDQQVSERRKPCLKTHLNKVKVHRTDGGVCRSEAGHGSGSE